MSAKANACIHIAADLLRAVLSDIPEDWPRSMPRVALRAIAKQEDVLKDCAYRVRYAGNCLRELDRECAALRARVEKLEAALRECADDLEAEVRATHGADHPDGIHPSQLYKYARDMQPVDRARALMEKKHGAA